MKFFLLSLLLVAIGLTQAGSSQEPLTMCSPNNLNPDLICTCTVHDIGWCSQDRPPNNCCKTHNEGKSARCGCCQAKNQAARWAGKLCAHKE